jgi:ABC-type transporter MlaC component
VTDMRRLLLLCSLWLALAPAAFAATALDYTRNILEKARAIVNTDQDHNKKLADLQALLKDFLDTDQMGRDALAEHAKQFSPAQLKEFLGLFRTLFQRTYLQKLLFFEKPVFEYVGETPVDGFTRVDTTIDTPRDQFSVTYRMRPAGDHWLATDIQVEDLSLTNNFRQQLDRLLSKGSVETLLGSMRRKYGSGAAEPKDGEP